MSRQPRAGLLELAERLSERDRSILATAGELRLLRGEHARRLFFADGAGEAGAARVCRRWLARLVEDGLLARLERRRVGGVRAGSAGHVYTLTAKGRRLQTHSTGAGAVASSRGVYEPTIAFVEHTLAIADLYVALVEAERSGRVELLAFQAEPDCWRTFTSPIGATVTVKPDAHVRLGVGAFEYAAFVEVDCGTVGRGALLRKTGVYLGYYRSGREQAAESGLFPKVVWIARTRERARYLDDLFAAVPASGLFAVTTSPQAIDVLAGASSTQSEGTAA